MRVLLAVTLLFVVAVLGSGAYPIHLEDCSSNDAQTMHSMYDRFVATPERSRM